MKVIWLGHELWLGRRTAEIKAPAGAGASFEGKIVCDDLVAGGDRQGMVHGKDSGDAVGGRNRSSLEGR